MNQLLKRLTKYIIILSVSSIVGYSWVYVKPLFYGMSMEFNMVDQIPSIFGLLVQITVAALLFWETRQLKLKLKYLTLISSLFYPLLGIVIFSLNFMSQEKSITDAETP